MIAFGQSRRSRTGQDKEFTCPEPGCNKSYYDKCNMYRHRKKMHSKTTVQCDQTTTDNIYQIASQDYNLASLQQYSMKETCERHPTDASSAESTSVAKDSTASEN